MLNHLVECFIALNLSKTKMRNFLGVVVEMVAKQKGQTDAGECFLAFPQQCFFRLYGIGAAVSLFCLVLKEELQFRLNGKKWYGKE